MKSAAFHFLFSLVFFFSVKEEREARGGDREWGVVFSNDAIATWLILPVTYACLKD